MNERDLDIVPNHAYHSYIITLFHSSVFVIMEAEVSQLRQQLAEAEQNTVLAATYGKQLLEEKNKLEAKLEVGEMLRVHYFLLMMEKGGVSG